jgi:hypothetical protein
MLQASSIIWNVRVEGVKLLETSIGVNVYDFGLQMILKAQAIK